MTHKVSFVGAGPGDPGLLTRRAFSLLQEADIVLYDALVSDAILETIPRGVRSIPVGKRAGGRGLGQAGINRMLVRLAQTHQRLVRLKGGDPAIFGRLGEEIAALRAAGVAFEIVPGITAASAAAAASGIPLTLRGRARRVQFVTGHARNGEALDLDWPSLADPDATTVFYMARSSAGRISGTLIAQGLSAHTPVLLMSDVGQDSQMRMRVCLLDLPQAVQNFPPEVPLVMIMGAVAKEAESAIAACLVHTRDTP